MNYYAKLYTDEYYPDNINPDDIKVYISVIEGIYEIDTQQKARVVCTVNITENKIYKWRKHPFNVIGLGEYTIILKKDNYDNEIHRLLHEETYTLLSHLLITEGYTQERVNQITTAIHNISNNKAIKTYQYCLRNWINF
jgi:hypothetical protein